MKIKVDKDSITKCLDIVTKASPSKAIIPIDSCIKLIIKGDTCYACCKSGTLQIKGQFKVESKEDFNMCIPSEVLLGTIRLLDEKEINLNYNPKKCILNVSAKNKRYKITGVNPKDFQAQKVKGDDLRHFKCMAGDVIPYIDRSSNIADWNGMREQIAGVTLATVTDGKDMYISGVDNGYTIYRAINGVKLEKELGVVIPRDITMALKDMKGQGEFSAEIGKQSIEITLEGFKFWSPLNNVSKVVTLDSFFEYDSEKYVVVNKKDIIMGAKRLIKFSSDEHSLMIMDLRDDELVISAENDNHGRDGEEILEVKNNGCENLIIGFNINKLLNTLSTVESDQINIYFTGENKPIRITKYNGDSKEAWCLAPVALKVNNG